MRLSLTYRAECGFGIAPASLDTCLTELATVPCGEAAETCKEAATWDFTQMNEFCFCARLRASGVGGPNGSAPCFERIPCPNGTCGGGGIACAAEPPECPSFNERIEMTQLANSGDEAACQVEVEKACSPP